MGAIELLIIVAVIASVFSRIKKSQDVSFYKTSHAKRMKRISTPSKQMRVLPMKDLIRSYSQKDKECFEHEVTVSSLNSEKPKRKKGLWNEPSWDDELYS